MNPDSVRQIYEEMVATKPDVPVKGAALRYTSLNGNMFSFLTQEGGIALRLGDAELASFRAKYKADPVVQHGATMRGYVLVPPTLLRKPAELASWFAISVAHARALPAKPTSRKAKPKR
jgi:hypothetical protein